MNAYHGKENYVSNELLEARLYYQQMKKAIETNAKDGCGNAKGFLVSIDCLKKGDYKLFKTFFDHYKHKRNRKSTIEFDFAEFMKTAKPHANFFDFIRWGRHQEGEVKLKRENIRIERTGCDYDCIATIINENDEDCVLSIKCPECDGIMTDHMAGGPWYIKAGEGFALFANDMGYFMLKAMESGIYCLDDSQYYKSNEYDFNNFAQSVFNLNDLIPCCCIRHDEI